MTALRSSCKMITIARAHKPFINFLVVFKLCKTRIVNSWNTLYKTLMSYHKISFCYYWLVSLAFFVIQSWWMNRRRWFVLSMRLLISNLRLGFSFLVLTSRSSLEGEFKNISIFGSFFWIYFFFFNLFLFGS